MPKINVYLPDELADEVKALNIQVSRVAQEALRQEIERVKDMPPPHERSVAKTVFGNRVLGEKVLQDNAGFHIDVVISDPQLPHEFGVKLARMYKAYFHDCEGNNIHLRITSSEHSGEFTA
ncbi:hypothetical protein FHT40_004139 [Mycolicibacterium sp. BK556]|uniref:type II toxin-antitoxin system CcdA family antitoxin n=1 Tax=unclassified Mycolicibacterium TaxID=2636767 RepID=UPI00161105BB|nr:MULTISPECIES: type II toxin-antitoxin system CcdA family antitoxin [unclassified Mycolicibacterium]MBB3604461.1 hypothetical protein [Mycolicibacterium sp. BK556]MBB3634826.1 hypothetical protein [Mycolicibacterium sp. BK607]